MCPVELKIISTVDALCNMMENDIYSLEFPPGSRITEADLTARYGVSRNSIREAIAFLLANGLLIKVANKGVYVREISLDDVREIFHLRGLLEAEAVRSIVESGVIPVELMHLAKEIESISPDTNWTKHVKADISFHELLVSSAGSSRLMRLYEDIIAEVKLCIYQSHDYVPLKQENAASHMILLKAMEDNNLEKALKVLNDHMEHAIQSYEAGFKNKMIISIDEK